MAKRKTNGKSLVIVESPAKAKTINKYLGDEYVVKASLGHVRDLPQRDFGIDPSNEFKPVYEVVKRTRQGCQRAEETRRDRFRDLPRDRP